MNNKNRTILPSPPFFRLFRWLYIFFRYKQKDFWKHFNGGFPMSKNKTPLDENPIFIKMILYLLIFFTVALTVLFPITHDNTIPPYIYSGIGALCLPFLIRMIQIKYEKKKYRVKKQELEKMINDKKAERSKNDKEYNEGMTQKKVLATATLHERESEKDSRGQENRARWSTNQDILRYVFFYPSNFLLPYQIVCLGIPHLIIFSLSKSRFFIS